MMTIRLEEAEAMAILRAFKYAKDMGQQDIEIIADNQKSILYLTHSKDDILRVGMVHRVS